MLFDVKAARARIDARGLSPADLPQSPPISGLAELAGGNAETEKMAAPAQIQKPTPQPPQKPSAETYPHGLSVTGQPLTWTGRIVSLDDWRRLTEWEKNGQNGRLWSGITKQWEQSKGKLND